MSTPNTLSDNNKSVTNNSETSVVIVGGILIDAIALPLDQMSLHSSNPVTWQYHLGGVAGNVARACSVNSVTHLIACIGSDAHGAEIESYFDGSAISVSLIKRANQASDTYTAVLDENRDLLIGLADAKLAQTLTWPEIQSQLPAAGPNAIVLDANLSSQCLAETISGVKHLQEHQSATDIETRIIGLAVSPVKVQRLITHASALDLLICNRLEAEAFNTPTPGASMQELGNKLSSMSFSCFVITDGANPALVYEHQSQTLVPVPSITLVKTVNGAGDALSGATISAWLHGKSLADAVRLYGMLAAADVLTGNHPAPIL